jgi:3'(2'), 5'-bisphosphate nucleotidase
MGSSLKFCKIACGELDLYPRFGPTSEWDTAAAQAVLEGAGGAVFGLDGQPLRYNTKQSLLNPHFIAVGDPRLHWQAWL